MTLATVRLPIGGVDTRCVLCPGPSDRRCGQHVSRPGRCPRCGTTITETEFNAATAQRDRWAEVEKEEAATQPPERELAGAEATCG